MCDLLESSRQAWDCGSWRLSNPLHREVDEILGQACDWADQLANKWVLIRNPQCRDETCSVLDPLRPAREMPFGWDPQP